MSLRQSIRDPSTNPPKAMFQLSGFYYMQIGRKVTTEQNRDLGLGIHERSGEGWEA